VVADVTEKKLFPDPDSPETLVQSNEYAEGLRSRAHALNSDAADARHAAYAQTRRELDAADARAKEARELADLIRSEGNAHDSVDL
jgi:hypothetical protein